MRFVALGIVSALMASTTIASSQTGALPARVRGNKSYTVLSAGAGPSLQLGGFLPNLLSVGGVGSFLVRGVGDHDRWALDLSVSGSYVVTVTPATLYGIEMRGSHFGLTLGACGRLKGYGVCGGCRLLTLSFLKHTPSEGWDVSHWTPSIDLGVDKIVQLRDRLSIRPQLTLIYTPEPSDIMVDERPDQVWVSPRIAGMVSFEVLFDFYKSAPYVETEEAR